MEKISVYLQRKPITCAVLEMRSSLRAVCTDVVFAQAVQRAFRAGNSTILFCFMTLLGVSWLFADPADSLSRYFETLLGTLLTSCNLSSLPQKSYIILSLHAHWHTDGSVDRSKWTPDYLSEWWLSDDLWPFTHPGFVLSPMYVDYLGFVHYFIFLCHNSQIALHIARPLNLCICDCCLFVIKLPAGQSLFFPWLTVVWYFILCACLNLFDLLSCTAQCEPSNAFVLMKSLGHEKQFTAGT